MRVTHFAIKELEMLTMSKPNKLVATLLAVALIAFGGALGFVTAGAISANLVTGASAVSDATTVAVSAIFGGLIGAALGFFVSNQFLE